MLINLEALGVSEEALTNAVLTELGMSKEEAVKALADKFGVNVQPAARAVELNDEQQRILKDAGELLTGIFNAEVS